jgi:hypothetical protein
MNKNNENGYSARKKSTHFLLLFFAYSNLKELQVLQRTQEDILIHRLALSHPRHHVNSLKVSTNFSLNFSNSISIFFYLQAKIDITIIYDSVYQNCWTKKIKSTNNRKKKQFTTMPPRTRLTRAHEKKALKYMLKTYSKN